MIRTKKTFAIALGSFLLGSFFACKVPDDAIATSHQVTSTATSLNEYYSALSAGIADTIALYELDAAISGIPYGAEDRKLQETTRAEIEKRKELARTLAKLASSMASLSNSKAASEVENSATELGNELIALKALPDGSPVPAAIGKAGNFLLQILQQHEEKKAARAMDETLSGLLTLFEKEKPAYDSIARTHARQASQVARDLINSNAVDPAPMLSPALKPFGLTSLPPSSSLQASLKTLALARLKTATEEATLKEEAASTAMLDALREMSSRVHLLANEKPMPLRGDPTSLKLVRYWVESWSAS
ncbi:MAG: hypothetical protein JSS87_09220 [Acidobacteria bacterium]|nr:hypothetical protein [Acidobacteriota bacterium]